MIHKALIGLVTAAALAGPVAAQGPAGAQMVGPSPAGGNRATMTFVTNVAQSDAFERQEGRLAESHASDRAVRAFAARMVRDHTRSTMGLKKAVQQAGLTLPPPGLSDDQKTMLHGLQTASDFDKTYVDQQVQAHQQAQQLLQGYINAGSPGPIRNAAKATLPMVQHHLDMATKLQARVG